MPAATEGFPGEDLLPDPFRLRALLLLWNRTALDVAARYRVVARSLSDDSYTLRRLCIPCRALATPAVWTAGHYRFRLESNA